MTAERVGVVNRIRGDPCSVKEFPDMRTGYAQLSQDRGAELQQLRTGNGRPLPTHLRRQIVRLELLLEQAKAVKTERAGMLVAANQQSTHCGLPSPPHHLLLVIPLCDATFVASQPRLR
jgi:transposase